MSWKDEYISRYGEAAYDTRLAYAGEWREKHPEEVKAGIRRWREEHPEEAKALAHEESRKGGRRYEKKLQYQQTGVPGERQRIRMHHRYEWHRYKRIIAPESQIHHEWIPGTAEYRGVALVEKDQHMHGIVDVIKILDGEITLRTEEEIRAQI